MNILGKVEADTNFHKMFRLWRENISVPAVEGSFWVWNWQDHSEESLQSFQTKPQTWQLPNQTERPVETFPLSLNRSEELWNTRMTSFFPKRKADRRSNFLVRRSSFDHERFWCETANLQTCWRRLWRGLAWCRYTFRSTLGTLRRVWSGSPVLRRSKLVLLPEIKKNM